MTQGKKVEVSAAQRPTSGGVGRRVSRCMRSGAPMAVRIRRFICYRITVGSFRAVRRRSPRTLTLNEREGISRGIAFGFIDS